MAQALCHFDEPRLCGDWLPPGDRVVTIEERHEQEVRGGERGDRPERACSHEQLAITDERDHVPFGQGIGDSEGSGGGGAHRAAEVEVRAVI